MLTVQRVPLAQLVPEVKEAGLSDAAIAAEQLGRRCCGMEISPAYCDVIVKRWETLTGKKAVLDGR